MDSIEYRLVLRDELSSALEHIHGQAKGVDDSMNSIAETTHRLKSAIIEMVGAYAGFETIKESMEIVHAQKLAVIDLTQVYKNNSQYTKESLEGMENLADQQEKLTGIHKEDIETLETNLLKHHNLRIAYSEAIPVIENYAKATGQNVVEAGSSFERSLTSSRGALMMLKQAGEEVNKTTILHLQTLYNSGQGYKAQAEVLALLKQRYQGVAEAMFNGDPEAQLSEEFRQAQEAIGHFAEEILVDLMPILKYLINDLKEVFEWISKHKEGLETLAKVILVGVAALKAYEVVMLIGNAATKAWVAAQALAAGYTAAETAEVAGLTTAMEALDIAMDANPIGIMIAAVGALTVAFGLLGNSIDNVTNAKNEFDKDKLSDEKEFGKMSPEEREKKYGELVESGINVRKMLKQAEDYSAKNKDDENMQNLVKETKYQLKTIEDERFDLYKVMNPDKAKSTGSGIPTGGAIPIPKSSEVTGQKQLIINVNINKMVGIENSVNKHAKDDAQSAGEQGLKMIMGSVNQFAAEFDI